MNNLMLLHYFKIFVIPISVNCQFSFLSLMLDYPNQLKLYINDEFMNHGMIIAY